MLAGMIFFSICTESVHPQVPEHCFSVVRVFRRHLSKFTSSWHYSKAVSWCLQLQTWDACFWEPVVSSGFPMCFLWPFSIAAYSPPSPALATGCSACQEGCGLRTWCPWCSRFPVPKWQWNLVCSSHFRWAPSL